MDPEEEEEEAGAGAGADTLLPRPAHGTQASLAVTPHTLCERKTKLTLSSLDVC